MNGMNVQELTIALCNTVDQDENGAKRIVEIHTSRGVLEIMGVEIIGDVARLIPSPEPSRANALSETLICECVGKNPPSEDNPNYTDLVLMRRDGSDGEQTTAIQGSLPPFVEMVPGEFYDIPRHFAISEGHR